MSTARNKTIYHVAGTVVVVVVVVRGGTRTQLVYSLRASGQSDFRLRSLKYKYTWLLAALIHLKAPWAPEWHHDQSHFWKFNQLLLH